MIYLFRSERVNLSSANAFNLVMSKILLYGERKKSFEDFVGKGENAGNQHFVLIPRFLPFPKQISIFGLLHFIFCKCFQCGPD